MRLLLYTYLLFVLKLFYLVKKYLKSLTFYSFYFFFLKKFGSYMQGKQTGEFIRALSVALRLLFYFFIAMLCATNWQILLPLVISIITCGKQRQLWDMRLYLSDQKKKTNEKIKVERHQWVKGYENLRGSNIHKTFFSKKKCKIIF